MRILGLLGVLWFTSCSVFGIRDTPEPPYKTLDQLGPVVIRQYGPRIAAETTIEGDEFAARSTGFRRLAGYIFGANHARTSIAMTAPVAQVPGSVAATIGMTAPVAAESTSPGVWEIRFFMPPNFTLATLPVPDDASVHLVQLPAETYAVLRFSGFASVQAIHNRTAKLLETLRGGTGCRRAPQSYGSTIPLGHCRRCVATKSRLRSRCDNRWRSRISCSLDRTRCTNPSVRPAPPPVCRHSAARS